MRNQIEFKVTGRYALFTDPLTRVGGEKFSYPVPTVQALIGICESIYWKPTFYWVIDSYRVINPIRMQAQGIRPISYGGEAHKNTLNTLSYYTYLSEPEYEVRAHFEWNLNREDLKHDRIDGKHYNVAKRMLEKGGRRDIFLGTRECQGYVEPVEYGVKPSYYERQSEVHLELMFHSFIYPSLSGNKTLEAVFHRPVMRSGEVLVENDKNVLPRKLIKPMEYAILQTSGIHEFANEEWMR
jgi:CRISPR-associated protein Cas5d